MHFSPLPLLISQDIWVNVKCMWSSDTVQTSTAWQVPFKWQPVLWWDWEHPWLQSSDSFLFSSDSLHHAVHCDPWRLQDWLQRLRVCPYSSMMGIYWSRISGAWNTPGWPFTATGWNTTASGIVLVAQGEPHHAAPVRASTVLRDPVLFGFIIGLQSSGGGGGTQHGSHKITTKR